MEILFPDVIGSGGAPKRITKPRRKGLDALPDSDDLDTPGTNVMNLLSPGTSQTLFQAPASQTPIHPPTVPSNGTIRPPSTNMPSRTSIASSSALTPPDEEAPMTAAHTRKRFLAPNNATASEKRRRTGNNNYIDLTHSSQLLNVDNHHPQEGLNGTSSSANTQSLGQQVSSAGPSNNPAAGGSRQQIVQDAMLALSEFARGFRNAPPPPPPTPRWPEQAMELFFRDFTDEDMDLQIKIGEKVLSDSNKAMMFCLMPEQLRQHWVKRLRELHNRMDVSVGLNSNSNNSNSNMNAGVAAINGNSTMMNGAMMQMGGAINGGGGAGGGAGVGGGMGRNGSQVG